MLQAHTVEPGTLELLKLIQANSSFKTFYLVGGTNLSLRFGHRLSVDLDFFTEIPFDSEDVWRELRHMGFQHLELLNQTQHSLLALVNGIRVDFILHDYPLLARPDEDETVKLASVKDVAAMKVNAATKRGAKKDFYDLAELLSQFTLDEILGFYKAKYTNNDLSFVLRSLVYFDDAEKQAEPISLTKQNWEEVKGLIVLKVSEYFNK